MNTQSHVLLGAALFGRPGFTLRNASVISGSLFPDLPLYGLFAGSKLMGIEERRLWREIYWSEPWPSILGASHSFLVLGALLLAGFGLKHYTARQTSLSKSTQASATTGSRLGEFLLFFAAGALLHAATDFPLHRDDAHQQFWPLSSYRFRSPVSYWDSAHYGSVWMVIESLLGLVLAVVIWRRFERWWIRGLAVLAILLYVTVPVYFFIQMGHDG